MATEEEPPATMRALALAKLGKPEVYDVATVPTPKITREGEVLIKVEAASVNPVDVKMASGYVFDDLRGRDGGGDISRMKANVDSDSFAKMVFNIKYAMHSFVRLNLDYL
jgi:NADPH:quinone reductase-like Zn-dependent oxidoreductase